jgi:hypothetical protein
MKHTKGPWDAGLDHVWDEKGRLIAHIQFSSNPTEREFSVEEGHANTQLIATAPEMLDALLKLVSQPSHTFNSGDLLKFQAYAREIIDKAIGKAK